MVLYILAAIGAVTVAIVLVILILVVSAWLGQPTSYFVRPDESQRYLRSWGMAIAEGGRIQVRQPDTDRSVVFVKRQYKRSGERLVFRFRNADAGRKYFDQVESAFADAGISYELERTPTGRARALVIAFPFRDDPLTLAAAAHAARLALEAMGTPSDGPFELTCTGSHHPGYARGSADVIPWTRGYRAGFRLGKALGRLVGRS